MTDEISRWGRPGFEKQIGDLRKHRDLAYATGALTMGTRKLIYAFIQRGGSFKRGTWDGCVINAISGNSVSSISAAADFFREPYQAIADFITSWDATSGTMGQSQANQMLERILLECGVTGVSPVPDPGTYEKVKVYRVRLFTSAETAAVEELRAEIDAGAFDADLASFQELVGV